MLIVGGFAMFHGHAHGTELPAGSGALAYVAGFALATALLHAAGIGFGVAARELKFARICRFAGATITLGGVYLAVG
jgi:urease accessory protein